LPSNVYNVPDFTCSWNPSSGLVAGDPSTVSVTINSSNPIYESHCTARKVFYIINPALQYPDTAYIEIGTVQTSGALTGKHGEIWTWPLSGPVVFRSSVTCIGDGKSGTESRNCSTLSLTAPPPPIKTGSIAFSNLDYTIGGNYFYKGTIPQVSNSVTVSNSEAKCGSVTTSAIPSTNNAGTVKVYAQATCRGTLYKLDSATATVVENPKLNGTCTWTTNGKPITGSPAVTTQPKGAIPSGVSLANSYGRCGAFTDDALPTSAFSGNGLSAWPAGGMGLEVGLYNGISTNVTCTPAVTQVPCPALDVVAALSACDGESILSTLCPNTEWEQIKWNVRPQSGTSGCFYVLDITGDWGLQANHRVNGTAFGSGNGTNRSAAANPKIDGGVYIYVETSPGYVHNPNNVTPGTERPFCQDRVHSLSCKFGADVAAGQPVNKAQFLTCRSGDTPTNISFTGGTGTWNWDAPAAGSSYTGGSASANCASVPVNAACSGTLNAINAPSCAAFAQLPTLCPGVSWSSIKWNASLSGAPDAGCYYATSINSLQIHDNNASITFLVNGIEKTKDNCNSNCSSGIAKIDNGYYIYIPIKGSGSYYTDATSGKPSCAN